MISLSEVVILNRSKPIEATAKYKPETCFYIETVNMLITVQPTGKTLPSVNIFMHNDERVQTNSMLRVEH